MDLEQILSILISSIIGAALSQIVSILAARRINNPSYNLFYKIKFHLLLIIVGLFILIILFLFTRFLSQ